MQVFQKTFMPVSTCPRKNRAKKVKDDTDEKVQKLKKYIITTEHKKETDIKQKKEVLDKIDKLNDDIAILKEDYDKRIIVLAKVH